MSRTNNDAVVLFSGGQDSTTCLYWAIGKFDRVIAITFDYGQRHRVELEQSSLIAKKAGVRQVMVPMPGVLGGSALVDGASRLDVGHGVNPDLPASFVPGRNMVFMAIAAGIAYNEGCDNMVLGVCETDFSGYPDCRSRFIHRMKDAMTLALDKYIHTHTPLMWLDKAQTWKMAKDAGCLDVVRDLSHTGYDGSRDQKNEWGYGDPNDPANKIRARGYERAKGKGWV